MLEKVRCSASAESDSAGTEAERAHRVHRMALVKSALVEFLGSWKGLSRKKKEKRVRVHRVAVCRPLYSEVLTAGLLLALYRPPGQHTETRGRALTPLFICRTQ